MRKILLFSSKTGNTEKIAGSIAQKLNPDFIGDVAEFDRTSLNREDVIIVGGWIDKGYMNKEVMKFIGTLTNKKVAFFFTLGAYPNSMYAFTCIKNIKTILQDNGNEVIAHYHCQGAVDPQLIAWMQALPEGHAHGADEDRMTRWNDAKNHPNQEDFNSAQNFAITILKKLATISV